MKKRSLTFLICMILIANHPMIAYADAATVTVTGGSIATAGLTGGALVSAVAPYAAPIILGAMVAGGMDIYLTEASKNAGMTKSEFVTNKIRDYCDAAGRPIDKFWQGFADNVSIAENGAIYLGDQARTNMRQFINWLQQEGEIFDSSSSSGSDDAVSIGDYSLPLISVDTVYENNNGNYYYKYTINSGSNVAQVILTSNGQYYLGWISNQDFSLTQYYSTNGVNFNKNFDVSRTRLVNGYYVNTTSPFNYNNIGMMLKNIPVVNGFGDMISFANSLDGSFDIGSSVPTVDTVIDPTGTATGDTTGALSPSAGSTTVYTPDLTSGIDLTNVGSISTTIQDYLDALRDALDGVQNPSLDGVTVDTGAAVNVDVGVGLMNPALDIVQDVDIPSGDQAPEDMIDPEANPEPDETIPQLTMPGLDRIFPFCLPFDIYKLVSKLAADPVAPQYHVKWMVPFINTYMEFDVDLSPWDDVASILRKMEVFSFIVGLAYVTREMFIKG